MNKSRKRVRIGVFSLEGAAVLLLTAAGLGLLRHNLPIAGRCTFGAIPLIIFGAEMVYAGLSRRL